MLDVSAGGNIKWKTLSETHELTKNMVSNDNELHNEITQPQQKGDLELQS